MYRASTSRGPANNARLTQQILHCNHRPATLRRAACGLQRCRCCWAPRQRLASRRALRPARTGHNGAGPSVWPTLRVPHAAGLHRGAGCPAAACHTKGYRNCHAADQEIARLVHPQEQRAACQRQGAGPPCVQCMRPHACSTASQHMLRFECPVDVAPPQQTVAALCSSCMHTPACLLVPHSQPASCCPRLPIHSTPTSHPLLRDVASIPPDEAEGDSASPSWLGLLNGSCATLSKQGPVHRCKSGYWGTPAVSNSNPSGLTSAN
jgi:hypothetical protein